MTYGCGNYECKPCYPYVYRCECGLEYPEPIPNGEKIPECESCGWINEVMA